MNQKLNIIIFVPIAMLLLPSRAGEVGESSSKSESNEHGSNLFEENNKLRDEDKLCDVTIIVGDKSFRVHKNILSSASPYFKAMFTNENMRESLEQSNKQTIVLHELDAEAFEMLKDYMYNSQITIDDSTVQRLLAGASYLQMTNVKADCCAYMKKKVNAENCLGIKYIADKYSCSELLNHATDFALDAFEDVAKYPEFLELTEGQLVDIISSDELNGSEENVYEAVMSWIRYHLPYVLQHVRFPQMEPNYLSRVSQDPLIKACKQCTEYVKEAKDYSSMRHLSVKRADDMSSLNARFKSRKTDYLFAVGGSTDRKNGGMSSVERYDPRKDEWTVVASMNTPRSEVGVAVLGDTLYAVGGLSGSYLSTIECYDSRFDKWTDNITPIKSGRATYHSIISLNGILYVVGGYDHSGSVLQSVLKYDFHTNEWIECKPRRQKEWGNAVGVLDDYIYVFGGVVGNRISNKVERYDLKHDEWHDVSPMITKRYNFGAAANGGYLYAVGGYGEDLIALSSAERYDPRQQKWELISPMTEHRIGLGIAAVNGLIYAAGGRNSNLDLTNTVEVYDPSTNTWSKRASMLYKRIYFGLAAIKSGSHTV